ncbi:MAG: tetratricopeptide repeat protein [Candidatus Obscuribacterales bacterium]|nr:tetratricopeptide repeat protein [Candidatus Obscuribacterales bacterium]
MIKRLIAIFGCIAIVQAPALALEGLSPDKVPSTLPSANVGTEPMGTSGVQFTQIQDLAPQKRAENRPVKNKWAVVIGIDKFVEAPLNNGLRMDKAAEDFYQYLVDPKAGRFEKDHVRLLTNQAATRSSIVSTLGDKWLGQVAGPDDLVVVFIGTHGFPAADGVTYLCAQNTILENVFATGISMSDLMSNLKKQVKTDRIVVVLQACYSGAAQLTSGAKSLFHFYNVDLSKFVLGKGYVIVSSSKPNEVTWGDIFSSNLIKGLRTNNGLVSLNDAFKFAQEQTHFQTTHECQGCKEQTPVMKSEWTGNDLILGTPSAEKTAGLPAGVNSYLTAESQYVAANSAVMSGDLDGAIKSYRGAIAADDKYADAYNDYATALALKGAWGEAIDQYKRAIDLRPDDELFHANLARALIKTGKTAESLTELQQAYKLNSKDRVVLTALADICAKQGDLPKSSLYLKEAVHLYPNSGKLHDRLSYVLAQESQQPGEEEKLDLALMHAREATRLDPKSTSAFCNLGSVLLLKQDSKGAIVAYRNAIDLNPQSADAYFLLGSALEKNDDKKGASDALKKFLDLASPQDPRQKLAKQKLETVDH